MTPVRLEPAAPRSRVKHSSTEPQRSLMHRVKSLPEVMLQENSFLGLPLARRKLMLSNLTAKLHTLARILKIGCAIYRVHTGKIVSNSRTFQGLLKDFPTVFKD